MTDIFNPDGTLVHYGVKGMKWGVIRDNARSAGSKAKAELKNPSGKTRAVGTAAVAVGLLATAALVGTKGPQIAAGRRAAEQIIRRDSGVPLRTVTKYGESSYGSIALAEFRKLGIIP